MAGIERPMSKEELMGLNVEGVPGVNLNKSKRNKNAREKFEIELQSQEKKATRSSLPFARQVAREEFNGLIKAQIDAQLREFGNVEHPEKIKVPKIDWDKYSNLKNFDLIKTHERPDTDLSNKNPGINVQSKVTTYKYSGYGFIYKIMESGPDSIARAIKNRAKLDKTISKELS